MKTHRRDVLVSPGKGGIQVSVIPADKIDDVGRGDVIKWTCRNETKQAITLQVGNFRPARGWANVDECRDTDPFTGKVRGVRLAPGAGKTLTCRVKKDAHYPRTYKYDFLDARGRVLLDPEIEIER